MNKTAVITGSSRGIGKEIALAFAKRGYNVVVNSAKSEKEGKMVAKQCQQLGVGAIYVKADVSTDCGAKLLCKAAYENFGRVDVLVNNAGKVQQKLLIDCEKRDVVNVLFGNISCVVYPSIEFLKQMKDCGGSIINISSIQAECKGANEALYATSKAAICGFTKAVACEYGACNVRVNAICPGFIETDMTKSFSKEDVKDFAESTPLGRIGKPADVAGVAVFLASDEASFITGECIVVDGGVSQA